MKALAFLLWACTLTAQRIIPDSAVGRAGDTITIRIVLPTSGLCAKSLPDKCRVQLRNSASTILARSTITVLPQLPPPPDTAPTPLPAPLPTGAWFQESYPYATTADYLASAIYVKGEDADFASNGVIDPDVSFEGHASLRYTFPARGECTDYSIGRNISLPAVVGELWLEWWARFSPGFTTVKAGCASNPDYKFFLPRVQGSGRFNVMVGTSVNLTYTVGYPGGEDNFEGGNAGRLFDGAWHHFQFHIKAGGSGTAALWVDGQLVKDYGTVSTTATGIYGLAVGRNMNQGPVVTESVWWGRITAWTSKPAGWP